MPAAGLPSRSTSVAAPPPPPLPPVVVSLPSPKPPLPPLEAPPDAAPPEPAPAGAAAASPAPPGCIRRCWPAWTITVSTIRPPCPPLPPGVLTDVLSPSPPAAPSTVNLSDVTPWGTTKSCAEPVYANVCVWGKRPGSAADATPDVDASTAVDASTGRASAAAPRTRERGLAMRVGLSLVSDGEGSLTRRCERPFGAIGAGSGYWSRCRASRYAGAIFGLNRLMNCAAAAVPCAPRPGPADLCGERAGLRRPGGDPRWPPRHDAPRLSSSRRSCASR